MPVHAPSRPVTGTFLATLAIAVVGIIAVSWPQLADPFVRHDDFPALLGDHAAYYEKTLTEGRWLNYWWTRRPVLWPAQANYVLYLLGWAAFAAAFATNALGHVGFTWRAGLALLVVLTPQAFNIAQWFNTLVPGVWLLAVYAMCCLWLPWRVSVLLIIPFSALVFSAYTTYPFILLATVLMRHDLDRSTRNYVFAVVTFIVGFASALCMAYGLNWLAHGTFGISVGDWRHPNPAESLSDVVANLPLLNTFVFRLLQSYGLGHVPIGFGIFAAAAIAFFIVFLNDRREACFAVTPLVLGMGLLTVHALSSGVGFPVRATIFVWLSAAYFLIRAAMYLGNAPPVSFLTGGLVAILVGYLGYQVVRNHLVLFSEWQRATADIADQIPEDVRAIYIYGERWGIDGAAAAGIQSNRGLSERLRYLTAVPTIICFETPEACQGVTAPFDVKTEYEGFHVQRAGDDVFIRLPTIGVTP